MANAADDVWRLLGELAESQKETERRLQETDRLLREQAQTTEYLLREQAQTTEQRFQATERLLREQAQATEQRSRHTDQQIRQVGQQLGQLGNRLGEFVEWQVRPAAVRLFQERGIAVHELSTGVSIQRDGEGMEIDLLVTNTTEAVAVEVKSKLAQADVDEHLERLAKFKRLMPRYQDVEVMGAVAGIVVPTDVARYAYRQGLFVLAQSGDSIVTLNDAAFQPRAW